MWELKLTLSKSYLVLPLSFVQYNFVLCFKRVIISNLLMHLRREAEMLLIRLHQICWEDQKAWIGHRTELHTEHGLKCNTNYLLTQKNMKDCYLLVYDLEVQYPDQLQNINCSSTNGVEEQRHWSPSCIENCSEWDGLNAHCESECVSEKAPFNL